MICTVINLITIETDYMFEAYSASLYERKINARNIHNSVFNFSLYCLIYLSKIPFPNYLVNTIVETPE